ncbi:MAG: hypothetical protein GY761_04975 [Hyphomicrobiales bacterium]|nr:hypothetical protein [Hyphomicrobiales bacterium]
MHIRIQPLILLLLFGFPSTASADCNDKVRELLSGFWLSGPFHYVKQEWNINFVRQTAGKIAPGVGKHQTVRVSNGLTSGETIYIGGNSWKNDSLGWEGPFGTSWSYSIGMPEDFYLVKNATCGEAVEHQFTNLIKYSYTPTQLSEKSDKNNERHTIYEDQESGRIVRFERDGNWAEFIKMVVSFRFDQSIRIVPPSVDPVTRKDNSIRVFNQAVRESDDNCRESVIKLLQFSQNSIPFTFEITGLPLSGISSISGKFVSPRAVNYKFHGVQNHGGGTETTILGNLVWFRNVEGNWSKPNQISQLKLNLLDNDLLQLAPTSEIHIGFARCLDHQPAGSSKLKTYEYDRYFDNERGRLPIGKVLMHVEVATGYPIRFEIQVYDGNIAWVETRKYYPKLQMERPVPTAK